MYDRLMMEVECPHCHARGQMKAPPPGAVIIGPCPRCSEMVVVFCGRALALNKETMLGGSPEDKQEHLLHVLGEFLHERVEQIVGMISSVSEEDLQHLVEQGGMEEQPSMLDGDEDTDAPDENRGPISDEEFDAFLRSELPGLDDHANFRHHFG